MSTFEKRISGIERSMPRIREDSKHNFNQLSTAELEIMGYLYEKTRIVPTCHYPPDYRRHEAARRIVFLEEMIANARLEETELRTQPERSK